MNRYFTKRRAKPHPIEPKFELDISSALPATDNFRTSLIMNSLSARFSMLREQDDPYSILGKASDDSVLAPRRQSRLYDFGYTPGRGLHDIAEVSSISSSVRPPFAYEERGHSFVSENEYGTDDESPHNGSVMSRARHGEGNNLFGGRQKIYKIPLGAPSSETSLNNAGGMRGRALYDDDVSMSTFQKFRQEEKDRLARERDRHMDQDSPSKSYMYSPSNSTTITRQTSTSTSTSAPSNGRTSTAATSVTSQIGSAISTSSATASIFAQSSAAQSSPLLDRSATKTRRLYEQGLDRDILEQQSTAITRLNSLQKNIGRTSPPFSRSVMNGQDRSPRPGPGNQFLSTSPPRTSPPPGTAQTIDRKVTSQEGLGIQSSRAESPSPANQFGYGTLMSALNPNDRGKATAMGTFNKPKQFSEQQYLERQLTLRMAQSSSPTKDDATRTDTKSISSDTSESQSNYTTRSRTAPMPQGPSAAPTAFGMFQGAASRIKATGNSNDDLKPASLEPMKSSHNGNDNSGSDYDDDDMSYSVPKPLNSSRPSLAARFSPHTHAVQPPEHEHPAFRSLKQQQADGPKENTTIVPQSLQSSADNYSSQNNSESDRDTSSALGLSNGGLSGLIRQHLRTRSNQSSIYVATPGSDVPHFPSNLALQTRDMNQTLGQAPSDSDTPARSSFGHSSNPFDLEELKNPRGSDVDHFSPVSPLEDESSHVGPANQHSSSGSPRQATQHGRDPASDLPWQQSVKKSHQRGPSSETVHEQDALSSELAKRQRAIQERLRIKMESEAVSTQVAPTSAPSKTSSGPFRGFDMLRTKSSRESFKDRPDTSASSKSTKLFGLGGSSNSSFIGQQPLERPSFQSDRWASEESSYPASRSNSRPPTSRSATQRSRGPQSGFESSRPSHDVARPSEESHRSRDRKNSNAAANPTVNTGTRSRSNSVQSNGRSRSRNGRYRDDLEKAMVEGTSSRTTIFADPAPSIPEQHEILAEGVPEMPHQYASDSMSNGLKIQTNKPIGPNGSGFFESQGLFPPPKPMISPSSPASFRSVPGPSFPAGALSPRPSPGFAPNSPHLMSSSSRASPIPFSNTSTPPLSGNSTPVSSTFSNNPTPGMSNGRKRSASAKRSIQKSDIGEPRLISTSSVIETVDLPVGASLQNGLDDNQNSPPPVPPINPLRRRFGLSRGNDMDPKENNRPSQYQATNSGYVYYSGENESFKPSHHIRKSSSEGAKIGMRLRAQAQAEGMISTPALVNRHVIEGGMF